MPKFQKHFFLGRRDSSLGYQRHGDSVGDFKKSDDLHIIKFEH